jgi:DNA-binding PadR family transcriptional regulator
MDTNMNNLNRPENPLALAMMAMLVEGPMHPYEIAQTLRTRHGEEAIKIRFGSLYSVIAQLVARGWIVAHETAQQGNRPEHTKYRLTDDGREAVAAWLRELIAEPVKEYPKFEAALCLMAVLPYPEVAELIGERIVRLDAAVARLERSLGDVLKAGLEPLFVAEADYRLAMLKAERDYCRALRPALERRGAPQPSGDPS